MLKPQLFKKAFLWNCSLFLSLGASAHPMDLARVISSMNKFRSSAVMSEDGSEDDGSLKERKKTSLSKTGSAHHSHVATYRRPTVKLNKKGVKFVHNYLKKSNRRLYKIKKRSTIPFEIIDSVFEKNGVPVQLRYLAVIESELKPTATSHVGAKGPWQLMPETAQILGLRVDEECDERTDYYKSTPAAARYLKDLYAQFGDWLLVLAAYNGGPGPVYHAIHKSQSRSFWTMQRYLPLESRVHVKRFIATHYYFEGHGSITTLTKSERINYLRTVRRFENSHPGSPSLTANRKHSARKEKRALMRPATDQQSTAKTNNQKEGMTITPGFSPNRGVDTVNDKFRQAMASAETTILNSSDNQPRNKKK